MQDLLVMSLISNILAALVRKYYVSSDRNLTPIQSSQKRTWFAYVARKYRGIAGDKWNRVLTQPQSVLPCFASLLVDFILSYCQKDFNQARNMEEEILLLHTPRFTNIEERIFNLQAEWKILEMSFHWPNLGHMPILEMREWALGKEGRTIS